MSELYDSRKEIERLYERQRACIDQLPLIDELKARIAFLERELAAAKADAFLYRVERDNAEDFANEIAADLRAANARLADLKRV